MRTPAVTIFVVCILIIGLTLALYDYKKRGGHFQQLDISKTEAKKLKDTRLAGEEQVYKQDYEKAVEEYEQALRISPRDAYLHNDLGAAYYRLGLEKMEPPMAEKEFGLGVEIDARHMEADAPPKPLEMAKEALKKINSGIITVVTKDKATGQEIERYARSLKHYVHIEEEAAEFGSKEFWLTIITGKTKEAFLKAEKEYLAAIDIKSIKDDQGRKYSGYSTASRNLGTLYFRMGRKKDAIVQWRRALQLEPTDAELRELLGKYE